jgi:hypothetical protein
MALLAFRLSRPTLIGIPAGGGIELLSHLILGALLLRRLLRR